MTMQTADPPVAPSAQVVANAFVEQYYHILHHSPELVYRFYQDSSVLSRQEDNGDMTLVTTMQGINAKIQSLDYKNYKAEIKTADAQESYKDGVIVLVTGCLTGKDKLKKKFAQSFFLAPQSKGFFVLNDVFRYVSDKSDDLETDVVTIAKVDDSGAVPVVTEIEPHIPDSSTQEMSMPTDSSQIHVEKSTQELEKQREVASEAKVSVFSKSSEIRLSSVTESSQTSVEDDGAKNSYASILKKANDSPGPNKVSVHTSAVKYAPRGTEKKPFGSVPSASAAEPSVQSKARECSNIEGGTPAEAHSIFVRNLPIDVSAPRLEEEFKRFGTIKQGGVQVRSNTPQGTCYGFVEFLSTSSMESAMQASPIRIGGQQAFVEIKKTSTRVESGRGRFPSGSGGFRGENFRGRGGYGGSPRGFSGRVGFSGRADFSGRGRRPSRGDDGYQRGKGPSGRQIKVNRTNVSS